MIGRARSWLALALTLLAQGGCATSGALALSTDERALIAGDQPLALRVRGGPGSAVLRRRAQELPDDAEGVDLRRIAVRMERAMRETKGVGIAGPQVGLPLRIAVLLLDYRTAKPRAIFAVNPAIVERADEVIESYEGCLSVPGVGGRVLRNRWVQVRYRGIEGKTLEARFEGPNAILWQHELDHLDGVLYVDRLQGELMSIEEMRRRRDASPSSRPR